MDSGKGMKVGNITKDQTYLKKSGKELTLNILPYLVNLTVLICMMT